MPLKKKIFIRSRVGETPARQPARTTALLRL
jgi:hypothetical protein